MSSPGLINRRTSHAPSPGAVIAPELPVVPPQSPAPLLLQEVSRSIERLCRYPSVDNSAIVARLIPEFRIIAGTKAHEFPALPEEPESVRPSERISGEPRPELDRLLSSIRSYFDLKMGDEAYESFAASQPEESRVSRQTFQLLSDHVRSTIDTSEKESLLLLGLIYNAAAKVSTSEWVKSAGLDPSSPAAHGTVEACERIRNETDDHVAVLSEITRVAPELTPTLTSMFSDSAQKLFQTTLTETPNFGQLLLLESMEVTLVKYPELPREVKALHYAHSLLLVCGASGHEPGIGSRTMVEHRARQWLSACDVLSKPDASSIYRAILDERANKFGFDLGASDGRALTRLGAMFGMSSGVEPSLLKEVFHSRLITGDDRHVLITELNHDGLQGPAAILARYLPATLMNILQAASERRCEREDALATALRSCAHMLRVGREMITSDSGYETITARDVAKNARVLPLAPAECITVARTNGGVSFSIDPEWIELTSRAPGVSSTEFSFASLEPSPHAAFARAHFLTREIKHHLRCAMLARDYSEDALRSVNLEIASLIHKLSFIALFVPREFSPQDTTFAEAPDSSAGVLRRAHSRLGTLVADMKMAVESDAMRHFESNALESIDDNLAAIGTLIDTILSTPSDITVTFGPEGGHEYFAVSRGPDAETKFRFLPLVGWGAMNMATRDIGEYGPLVSMVEISRSGKTGLSHDQELSLFRRLLGPTVAIYSPFVDLSRDGAPRRLEKGYASSFNHRLSTLQTLAGDTREQAGRACDAITLLSGGLMRDRTPNLERIAEGRDRAVTACRDWVVTPSLAAWRKALKAQEDFNALVHGVVSIDIQYTSVVTRSSPDLGDITARLATMASRHARAPHDSDFARSGGFTTALPQSAFTRIVEAGGEIIVCRSARGEVLGGLVHIPYHALSRGSATDLLDLYKLYGRPSFIWLLQSISDADGKLPVYALLTSRYRLEAFGHDVAAFQIATANRRSLAMNLSESGRGAINPGHIPAPVSDRIVSSPSLTSQVSTATFVGAMAPLSPGMSNVFQPTRLSDSEAVRLADMVLNSQVSGLFKRDMADLMRAFGRVSSSMERLAPTMEGATGRQQRGIEARIEMLKVWRDRVVAYLGELDQLGRESMRHYELDTFERVLELAQRVQNHAKAEDIRELIDDSPLGFAAS